MRLTSILLALTAILLLTACANSNEDLPSNALTGTATSSPAAAVIFCPRIGGSSTPTTPTPIPSCQPPASVGDLSDVSLQETDPPPLPSGFAAYSSYYTVEGGADGLPATLSIDLLTDPSNANHLAWYTYAAGHWTRLEGELVPIGSAPNSDSSVVGTFNPLPENLIVLGEPQ